MNATAENLPLAKTPVTPLRRFAMLLRREFWEHRGAFLWTPVVAAAVSLLLFAGALVVALLMARSHGDAQIHLDDGTTMTFNGLDLGVIAAQMSADDMAQLGEGINITLMTAAVWPFVVMVFVMFFYCLGNLYDERKDRSVLFWKSLPVSDGETVLSKVVSAVVTIPLLATLASIAAMFGFLLVLSALVLFHSGNPVELLWGPASPLAISMALLAAIPVYAIWALPTVGWLMLCSAWARSVPFLWAVLLPVLTGVFTLMLSATGLFALDSGWFWKNIVARMLLGVVPITPHDLERIGASGMHDSNLYQLIEPAGVYSNLLHLDVWIGAAAGVAMLLVAVRLRRWRDEG